MSMTDFVEDDWEPLADEASALHQVQSGCVKLASGKGRCVIVQLAASAQPILDGDVVEGLVVAEGAPIDLGLDEAQVTLLDKKAPRKQRFGDRLELGPLTLMREPRQNGILRAFWFGVDGTLMIGANLTLDAWLSTPFPMHVAGTLVAPQSDKEIRRLERAGENDAWAYIRTVDLMQSVIGFTPEPWVSRLPGFGPVVRVI
jgi:hypothetical protein